MEHSYILTRFDRLFNPPNWYYNPNHLTNRIYYICGGTAFYQNEVQLKPGYIYIFRASSSFKVSQNEDDPIDHVYFDFVTPEQLITKDYLEISIEGNERLKKLAELVSEEFNSHNTPWEIGEAYFILLTNELKKHLVSNKVYSELTANTLRLIHEIDPSEISVALIASKLNMNENHIIRTFKKETSITPHKYINQMKASLAIKYLQQGMTLETIAEKLGYGSVSSLSVSFKTATKKNLSYFK